MGMAAVSDFTKQNNLYHHLLAVLDIVYNYTIKTHQTKTTLGKYLVSTVANKILHQCTHMDLYN